MKQIMALANPDILLEGRLGPPAVNGTTDELAFAKQRVGVLFQIFQRAAAHGRELGTIRSSCISARCRKFASGEGLDGCSGRPAGALFKHGQKQGEGGGVHQDADLRQADLAGFDRRDEERPIPGPTAVLTSRSTRIGPPNKPDWMPEFVGLVRGPARSSQGRSTTISSDCSNSSFGKPIWEGLSQGARSRIRRPP